MESYRKAWNKDQTAFRDLLLSYTDHEKAIQAFLHQHARLHSAAMAPGEPWSFEDWLLDDLDEAQMRRIPRNCEHSIAWCIWHITRIEDVTMNILVVGQPQLAETEGWFERLRTPLRHTGNAMDTAAVAAFSAEIDLEALRAYRQAVGRRTRQIVMPLQPEDLQRPVDPVRLQRVLDTGAVLEAARGITEYWGRRDVAGLLLMPPTRHGFIHLNEALKLKQRKQ
jgi:hypothetical protein